MILSDDIGFADIGCFGSEIQTPHLDRLSETGLRFTQFYNMSKCNPTRSSLLTGLIYPRQNKKNVHSVARALSDAGYFTAMSGKEHLDKWVPDQIRVTNSFDRSFVTDKNTSFFIPESGELENPFYLNGTMIPAKEIPLTQEPFYRTDVEADYAMRFIGEAVEQEKPFFLHLASCASHFPLQARPEDIAKYRDVYRVGWDNIRAARFEKQKQLGIFPEDTVLSPPSGNINQFRRAHNTYSNEMVAAYAPWETLSEKDQDELSLEMAVYAAMTDRMDWNIGRVLDYLEEQGVAENTIIVYCSDNGSCPYDSNREFDIPPGGPDSYRSLCAAWANVGNTPFRYFKQYGHEGGARTHFIASGPGVVSSGGWCREPAHIADLYPTFLELAGADYPETCSNGPVPPLDGTSLIPLFKGESRPAPEMLISGLTKRFRMVRMKDWKIVKVNDGDWELYQIEEDPTEQKNLAEAMPEKVTTIEAAYSRWKGE